MRNMRVQHIAAFALAVSVSVSAAEVKLGPEVPLSPVEIGPATAAQMVPTAASNGHDFLVAWQDARLLALEIFLTRVAPDGTPADPIGHRLTLGTAPKLAWGPGGYLLAWNAGTTDTHVRLQLLDDDGAARNTPPLETSLHQTSALVSNGTSYLLVAADGMAILDGNGAIKQSLAVPAGFVGAAASGNRYVVASANQLMTIAEDGTFTKIAAPIFGMTAAAFGPDAILFASIDGDYALARHDGTVIKASSRLPLQSLQSTRSLGVAFDGRQFLVTFTRTEAFRIATNGAVLDAAPRVLSSRPVRTPAFARSATTTLIVWGETIIYDDTIRARTMADFDAFAAPMGEPAIITTSPDGTNDVATAGGLAAWDDPGWYSAGAAINGTALEIDETVTDDYVGWPAIAAGHRTVLVVWRHDTVAGTASVLARRFDFSGHPLDALPLLLDTNTGNSTLSRHAPPSIAFDGTTYFIAWNRGSYAVPGGVLGTARLREEGAPFDVRATELGNAIIRHVRAFVTEAEFLVAFTRQSTFGQPVETPLLQLARFSRGSTKAPAIASPQIFVTYDNVSSTLGPDRLVYVWFEGQLSLAPVTLDGKPAGAVVHYAAQSPENLQILWNGSEYVVVWQVTIEPETSRRELRALRFDVNLRPLDAAPFVIAAGRMPPSAPASLLRTPGGVQIGYTIVDFALGAPHAVARTLASLGTPARKRATSAR